jgi:SAM-dependent MidA family methyltransferase
MSALLAYILEQISLRGVLSIAEYMDIALQHPEHGYYRKHDPLGRAGDFITAPEISQMFGEIIGLWCADMWRQIGKPKKFTLLELGPGRGTLMQDALRATQKISGFHQAMKLCLLESNATLRGQQRNKLENYNPAFLEKLDSLFYESGDTGPLIIIANEFFDALPVHQFEKTNEGWQERCIGAKGHGLGFTTRPIDTATKNLIPAELNDAGEGMIHEISPASIFFMQRITKYIKTHGGAAVVIDYGYTRSSGKPTLQAVSGHASVNVLERPGEVDLTAHVDFGVLQTITQGQVVTQREFLRTLGIDIRAAQLKKKATAQQAQDVDTALHRLTDASQMGELFKVLTFVR